MSNPQTSMPPVPKESIIDSRGQMSNQWQRWISQLQRVLSFAGGIAWGIIDKAGSALTDIVTRPHSMLQDVLGWVTGADPAQVRHISNANGKVWQDHVEVTNGNPHGTDHAMLDAIGTLTPGVDTVKDKHLSNAQAKVWEDHVAIVDANPHGTDHSMLDGIDTDTATTAIHHTLGTGANQSAAGNHTHSSILNGSAMLSITSAGEVQLNGADAVGDSGTTPDGGSYVCYTAGEALVAGDVVSFLYNSGAADTVNKVPTNGDRAIGIVYAGVANGAIAKVITNGRAAASFDAAPLKGSIALTDTVAAGRLTSSNAPDAASSHWRECGHPTGASVSRETRTLYFVNLHFN